MKTSTTFCTNEAKFLQTKIATVIPIHMYETIIMLYSPSGESSSLFCSWYLQEWLTVPQSHHKSSSLV